MKQRKRKRPGAAMLELAIIMPLLLILTGGIVDFARYAYYYIAVSNAAGAGARFASLHPYTPTTLSSWNTLTKRAVTDDLQGILLYNANRVTIPNPTVVTESSGLQLRRVSVQVDYAFQTLTTWPSVPNAFTIRRTVTMRVVR